LHDRTALLRTTCNHLPVMKPELEVKTKYRLIFSEKDTEIKNGKVYIKQTEKELTDLSKQLAEELELDI